MSVCLSVCLDAFACIHIYIYIYINVCVKIYWYIYIYIYICVCVCVCVCVYKCVRLCVIGGSSKPTDSMLARTTCFIIKSSVYLTNITTGLSGEECS